MAALITILTSSISWGKAFEELGGTWNQLKMPILMIRLVNPSQTLMNYAGMTTSIALALAAAGPLFLLLSLIIGWIGVFVTGSVTNANVLFAGLQSTTAAQIAVDLTLLVANTAGGVMGKIVPAVHRDCGGGCEQRRRESNYLHVHQVQRYSAGPGLRLVLRAVAHGWLIIMASKAIRESHIGADSIRR